MAARTIGVKTGGALVRTLTGRIAPVEGCAFSPDGRRIVSASFDGTLKAWPTMSYT